jgi:hypothetical protein
MAALAGMYHWTVQPWPELLADLTIQQHVHAAALADMWQLTAAHQAAMEALNAAADALDGLSALLEGFLTLPAMQDSVLPLFEEALLSKYGRLQALCPTGFFQDREIPLQKSLLSLPMHAMELLLASDVLKVGARVHDLPADL